MTPDNIAANMAAELADGWRALGVLELCFFGSRTADELRARCGIPCYDHHRHVQIRSGTRDDDHAVL